jgi:hypothetical protein
MAGRNEATAKVAIICTLVLLIGVLHFTIPTEPHAFHVIHIILRKHYYLPPVMAAAWFGLKGDKDALYRYKRDPLLNDDV